MLQTEDCFGSLTHAVAALLTMHGFRGNLDVLGAVTGDCFAVQVFPEEDCPGLAGCPALLQAALADAGLSAKPIADDIGADNMMRVFAIMRAGLLSFRPCLVWGAWDADAGERGGRRWGVVNRTHPAEPRFLGSTMQAPFLGAMAAQDIPWPREGHRTAAVFLVEAWRDPGLSESVLARRALQRGLSLLAGDRGFGGIAEYARLLHRLAAADPLDELAAVHYPYPLLVFVRCRFEAMARFLAQAAAVVPRHKRRACRQALNTATGAAQLLLDAEPPRAHPRTDRAAVPAGALPWPLTAWQARAADIQAPHTEARRREIALIEQLRAMHADLVETLDNLLARK